MSAPPGSTAATVLPYSRCSRSTAEAGVVEEDVVEEDDGVAAIDAPFRQARPVSVSPAAACTS